MNSLAVVITFSTLAADPRFVPSPPTFLSSPLSDLDRDDPGLFGPRPPTSASPTLPDPNRDSPGLFGPRTPPPYYGH